VSPKPKTRNPAIRQFCQLLLAINSLGTLVVVVASRWVPRAPRTGTSLAIRSLAIQSLAVHRPRTILASHGHLAAGQRTFLTRTHYATATPGPARGVAAAITRDRQSLWCSYPALIGCLTSPPDLRPSSRRSFLWHTACGRGSPLLTSSRPPGLLLSRVPRIGMSGGRHSVMPSG
jgi:hypothetical protein